MPVSVGLIRARAWIVLFCLCLFALGGCTARFVAGYDDVFDKLATDTQKKTAAFLLRLQDSGSPSRKFINSRATYDEIIADIQAMRTRANANNIDNLNRQTLGQIETIEQNIQLVQKQHMSSPNGPSIAFVQSAKSLIDIQFDSMIKLEAAKKRGEVKS